MLKRTLAKQKFRLSFPLKFVSANKDKVIKDNNKIVDQFNPEETIEKTVL